MLILVPLGEETHGNVQEVLDLSLQVESLVYFARRQPT
jgi:hypothetical protein